MAGAVALILLSRGDLRKPAATAGLDADAVRAGATVYRLHCASCHGIRGEGAPNWKRPGAGGVYPPPPHDSTGHTWHHPDGLLYRIVALGSAEALGDTAHEERYGMPAFDGKLSGHEIRAVVTFLKVRWTLAQRRGQADLSRADPFPDSAAPRLTRDARELRVRPFTHRPAWCPPC